MKTLQTFKLPIYPYLWFRDCHTPVPTLRITTCMSELTLVSEEFGPLVELQQVQRLLHRRCCFPRGYRMNYKRQFKKSCHFHMGCRMIKVVFLIYIVSRYNVGYADATEQHHVTGQLQATPTHLPFQPFFRYSGQLRHGSLLKYAKVLLNIST